MAAAGLAQQSITGMRYTPVLHRASWCRSTAVNYLASYAENPSKPAKLEG
jgi:2-polyprenyl-6-hydroxyphenyl methylase/3-demethylubiquinone-9 3-methyltransferase